MLGNCFFAVPLITDFGGPQGEAFLRFRYTGLPQKCAAFLRDGRMGARVKSASLSRVIPNGKSARQKTRALAREGPPRLLSLSGGFLAPLTSPLWGSCAVSSKCSCKQAFLLASGGMTEERGRALGTSPRWGSCAALSECSCKRAFLLASDGMS